MIGRSQEQKELRRAYESSESEFIMVYGRRRVGKTYLVREFFKDRFVFFCTGIAKGSREEQLMNFRASLVGAGDENPGAVPHNWMEAFEMLKSLTERSEDSRKVIFLDEVPWMYTQKSDFLKALDHFWNGWACYRKDVILIVCGSAASWMVKKIVKDKGGLHNRITLPLKLLPFTLEETRQYLFSQGIDWDLKTVAECYMSLGGIPYYLRLLDKGMSLAQNIDRLFFSRNAILKQEFENLYASLFKESKEYIKIVEILSRKKMGYTRDEIIAAGGFKDGGSVTEKLEDLEECGFIRKYVSRGEVNHLYQLTDFYTLFYYQIIKGGQESGDENYWMHKQGTQTYSVWKGLSFERLCFAHLQQIKRALGIEGVSTKAFAYRGKGFQIDMILEREDRHVNIFEMKYHDGPVPVSREYAQKLDARKEKVALLYKKRMAFSTVLVTVDGLQSGGSSSVQRTLTIEDLFN